MNNDFNSYAKISIATDIVVLTTDDLPQDNNRKVPKKGLKILLTQRDEEPHIGKWALPAGFVNFNESILDCAKRKLKEKVGLDDIYMEQLYTYGDNINRDERGRVVSIGYIALAPKEKIILNSEKASKKAEWFWIENTNNVNFAMSLMTGKEEFKWNSSDLFLRSVTTGERVYSLAFDHKEIITDALNRIKNKIMYTDVAFHLMNEQFTVKELQIVFELLLGKEMQGFRKLIEDKIVETDSLTDGKAHRPARLYKKK